MRKSTVEKGGNWVDIDEDGNMTTMVYDHETDTVDFYTNGEHELTMKGWHLRQFGWSCREMKNA